jgi:hypothetical protein
MMTFLVSDDFKQCARILDPSRLNRQIQDCCGVASILGIYEYTLRTNRNKIPFGIIFPKVIQLWISAPSSFLDEFNQLRSIGSGLILWPELYNYFFCLCNEWKKIRGEEHNLRSLNWEFLSRKEYVLNWPKIVQYSHRNRLLEKDYGYYSQKFRQEKLEYGEEGISWVRPTIVGIRRETCF